MLGFGEREITKEKFYAAKTLVKLWDVNVENIVISKLIETKTNSKYLIGVKFYRAIRPLALKMPKMSGYVNTFKVKAGDKDKNNKLMSKINSLMSFRMGDEKLLEKDKAIWTNIENLENNELNDLPVYDDRYIKTKIITYGYKVYTDFRGLNMPEDDIECEPLQSFLLILYLYTTRNIICKYI